MKRTLRAMFRSPRALLFWGSLLVFLALAKGYISVHDTQVRYGVARQIWYEGSILLPEGSEIVPFHDEQGRGVAGYGIAQSLLMLPAVMLADALCALAPVEQRPELQYLAGQFLYALLVIPLISALCVLAVHTLARRLGIDRRAAFWTALAFGFGTYWLYYTRTLGQNLEVAALCLASLCVYTGGERTPRRVAGAVALLAWTLVYRPEFLLPVVALLGVLAFHLRRHRELRPGHVASLLIPVFLCGCWVLLHNYLRSGSVLEAWPGANAYLFENEREAGSSAQDPDMLADYPGKYLLSCLLGPSKGFLWYSPVLLLGLLALVPGLGRWTPALTLGSIPVAVQLLFVSSLNWALYEGGWGPRYLLPLTPFLVLGAAAALRPALSKPRLRVALAAGVLAMCLVQVALSMEDHSRHLRQFAIAREQIRATQPETRLEPWHSSMLLSRLRNLSVFPLDPPVLEAVWRTPEVSGVPPQLSDELWWWKLSKKAGHGALARLLPVVGLASLLGGVALLGCLLIRRPRPCEPSPRLGGYPGLVMSAGTTQRPNSSPLR